MLCATEMIFPHTVRRASPAPRRFYSSLPLPFFALKTSPPCFTRGTPRWCLPCRRENALFTLPKMPSVPCETAGETSALTIPTSSSLASAPVTSVCLSVTSTERKSSSCVPISCPSASKTYMSRASKACLVSVCSFSSP